VSNQDFQHLVAAFDPLAQEGFFAGVVPVAVEDVLESQVGAGFTGPLVAGQPHGPAGKGAGGLQDVLLGVMAGAYGVEL